MPRTAARRTSLPRGQKAQGASSIQSFARTTKPGITLAPGDTKSKTPLLPISPSKKRKLNEIVEHVESKGDGKKLGGGECVIIEQEQEEAATPSKTLRIAELSVNSPRRSPSVRKTQQQIIHEDSVPVPSTPSKRSSVRRARQQQTPKAKSTTAVQRPQSFRDLLNLHYAFLKALTIHFAHNGAIAPADLREFLLAIEKLWKKRKVTVKDLQRLVWIWEQDGSGSGRGPSYRIANYGLGRICLERVDRGENVDENEMQERFEQSLELLWEKKSEEVQEGVDFVDTLDLVPIHESLTPFTSFQKGQQRLQDLRGGVIRTKMEKMKADEEEANKTPEAAKSRGKGLLDRIKSKSLRQSKLPPPPSKEMLQRRAAAERIEDVVNVVASLRPVGYVGFGLKATIAAQRKPYKLQTMVQHVQDSTRNPISAQEVEICLELLAQPDVAGHWVSMVAVSELKSVVLKSCADVSVKDIGAKVAQIRAGWDEAAFKLDTAA